MTIPEMKAFITERIHKLQHGEIEGVRVDNGILLHLIPQVPLKVFPIHFGVQEETNRLYIPFRSLSDTSTEFSDHLDSIQAVTPPREYYSCFKNGIFESFQHGIINDRLEPFRPIEVDKQFYRIKDFLKAATEVSTSVYGINPPYFLFISFIGTMNVRFVSLQPQYTAVEDYNSDTLQFEPFMIERLEHNYMPQIIKGVQQQIAEKVICV